MKTKFNKSEIINQKKQFIFKVEQTTNHVFPNEPFTYYVYIKNISGEDIHNFTIRIANPSEVVFEETEAERTGILIENKDIKLYKFKAYCSYFGEYSVHFIGYGEETQVLYQTLKIKCTRTYNSDKLLHRLHIYDFTPYEDIYTLEASNYTDQVTQLFKRQKLPAETYKNLNGKSSKIQIQKDFTPENIESESYIQQYNLLKNTKEHVYQYLTRENFTENSTETYTGENLYEVFEKINKESKYFRGKFFRSGTNTLLNDFRQYSPNGFIYRMGLLNSEIYQYLGVIPTYDYMSDKLFRWAPSAKQPLNLYPEKKTMKWGENVWAGKGWIIYKSVTPEYMKTEEYIKKKESHSIINTELLTSFEDKESAETFIDKKIKDDEIQRQREKSDIIKYNYYMQESIYEPGIFFVNIPINKIPSNFYLLNHEALSSIINRAKPYGTKAIINYIIEENFNHHMDIKLHLNYYKDVLFDFPCDNVIPYAIYKSKYIQKTIKCQNNKTLTYPSLEQTDIALFEDSLYNHDMNITVDSSRIGMNNVVNAEMKQELSSHITKLDYSLKTLKDLFDVLYQNNYENISFRLNKKGYHVIKSLDKKVVFNVDANNNLIFKNKIIESIKMPLLYIKQYQTKYIMTIKDIHDKEHKISVEYDKEVKNCYIKYEYINSNKKSFIRKQGYAEIQGVCVVFGKVNNKRILIYLIEDKQGKLHYFHHVIVQDVTSLLIEEVERVDENKPTQENSTEQSLSEDRRNYKNQYTSVYYTENISSNSIIFETPFCKQAQTYQPTLIKGGSNWINMYRLNEQENTYAYIQNDEKDSLIPDDISLYYDNINIPETSKIYKMRLKVIGDNNIYNQAYVEAGFNTDYITEELSGYTLQLQPNQIEAYSHLNESSIYYETKLDIAQEKHQETYVKELSRLLEENYIFDEDIDINIVDYLENPDDYITINKEHWCEISDFTTLKYKLNEVESIKLIIEGYNTAYESQIIAETVSETNYSSPVTANIPAGYFREKISLLYSNQFLLDILRVRFRFKELNHPIKIFDTKIELKFKNKQKGEIFYETFNNFELRNRIRIPILTDYYFPANLNNGLNIKMSFDELNPGDHYRLNKTELEIIYEDTDIDIMVNNKKYQDTYYNKNKIALLGETNEAYLSGEFYDDVPTMSQLDDNVGVDNKGIKLQNSLYQLFEARDDNITSIEIFPYGFQGNPDESLKLSLYTNSHHTPDKLIKEVYINGWSKNNKELRSASKIKYNFNVDNLIVNEKYWFKLEVINPQEISYYLLKGINKTKTGFKLLANENNNYINTFSNLKFNIYSRNLSKSFNDIPAFQDKFDNPYILVGLHKGQGSITKLQTNKPT